MLFILTVLVNVILNVLFFFFFTGIYILIY